MKEMAQEQLKKAGKNLELQFKVIEDSSKQLSTLSNNTFYLL